ncbi:MAG: F0F1 ATP synthase subunit epsilon, partial [Chloroflexota bacterium]
MTRSEPPSDHVNLLVLSPEQVLYQGPAAWVDVPLLDGSIGIWPGHAPLVAALGEGTVRFQTQRGEREVPVVAGILRVSLENCIVLVGAPALADAEALEDRDQLADEVEQAL